MPKCDGGERACSPAPCWARRRLPAAATPLARDFSAARPVNWISVAAAQPSQVWVETAAGGLLSSDGGRSFRAPLPTHAFRRAQVAQATLLADGKTLVAMPTVWSAQQFTAPRWSSDGGASWHPGRSVGVRRRAARDRAAHAREAAPGRAHPSGSHSSRRPSTRRSPRSTSTWSRWGSRRCSRPTSGRSTRSSWSCSAGSGPAPATGRTSCTTRSSAPSSRRCSRRSWAPTRAWPRAPRCCTTSARRSRTRARAPRAGGG